MIRDLINCPFDEYGTDKSNWTIVKYKNAQFNLSQDSLDTGCDIWGKQSLLSNLQRKETSHHSWFTLYVYIMLYMEELHSWL